MDADGSTKEHELRIVECAEDLWSTVYCEAHMSQFLGLVGAGVDLSTVEIKQLEYNARYFGAQTSEPEEEA